MTFCLTFCRFEVARLAIGGVVTTSGALVDMDEEIVNGVLQAAGYDGPAISVVMTSDYELWRQFMAIIQTALSFLLNL